MDTITLDVGGRRYKTFRSTLNRANLFKNIDWEENTQEDGSIFIDADPDLFEHILQFLRRGIMPVLWNLKDGHDYPTYNALLEEARHFQIPELISWLQEKRYQIVVQTQLSLYEWNENQKRQYVGRGEEEVYFVSDRSTYVRSVEFDEENCRAAEFQKMVAEEPRNQLWLP
ncbi:BTB/POZ protein [Xylariales sp. PMI_506]|nr:BTB/POZ protein [Xylariales sp. PMI_506]